MFDKLHVKGPEQHPLYAALTGEQSPAPGEVKWNFSKFLVGRDGKVLKRFDSKVTPDSPELTEAIEATWLKSNRVSAVWGGLAHRQGADAVFADQKVYVKS